MAKWRYENTQRWEFIKAMPRGGHRLWRERDTGRVSLADHSGDGKWVIPYEFDSAGRQVRSGRHEDNWYGNPEHTDDGPLFFDYSRPIKVTWRPFKPDEYRNYDFSGSVSVPVVDEDGDESRCGSSIADALYYVTEFGMRLEVDGVEYLVAEKGKELPFLAAAATTAGV
jgi:hypothetical protein